MEQLFSRFSCQIVARITHELETLEWKDVFHMCLDELLQKSELTRKTLDIVAEFPHVSEEWIARNSEEIRCEFYLASTDGSSIRRWLQTYTGDGNGQTISILLFYYHHFLKQLSENSLKKLIELYDKYHS